jgi:ABC-type proline/glycine betaine transport system permease subunit
MKCGPTVATWRWIAVCVAAAALVLGGAYCWELPWGQQAVLIGQIWTPHLALAMLALGVTALATGAVAAITAAHRRWQHRTWAFEVATLTIAGLAVLWLLVVCVLALGLIPAAAHFTESRHGTHVIVTRTVTTPNGVTRTVGEREGLLVRWGISKTDFAQPAHR